jgi:hypothetical protein
LQFLLAVALLSIGSVQAQYGVNCTTQAPCVKFTQETAAENPCSLSGCVKVCLTLLGPDDNPVCPGDYSHVCDIADSYGCVRGDNTFDQGDNAAAYYPEVPGEFRSDHKKEGLAGDKMCQYGNPGDILAWIVKKGADTSNDPQFLSKDGNDCLGLTRNDGTTINCTSAKYTEYPAGCGGGGEQQTYERVWTYEIGADDVCGGKGDTVCDCTNPSDCPITNPTCYTDVCKSGSCTQELKTDADPAVCGGDGTECSPTCNWIQNFLISVPLWHVRMVFVRQHFCTQ